jgi:hypothetical protein
VSELADEEGDATGVRNEEAEEEGDADFEMIELETCKENEAGVDVGAVLKAGKEESIGAAEVGDVGSGTEAAIEVRLSGDETMAKEVGVGVDKEECGE